jgi:hypothetical protein
MMTNPDGFMIDGKMYPANSIVTEKAMAAHIEKLTKAGQLVVQYWDNDINHYLVPDSVIDAMEAFSSKDYAL